MLSGPSRAKGHVGRACERCRRRKIKCDGTKPTCKLCAMASNECIWSEETDGRKFSVVKQIQTLKQRIRDLESAIQDCPICDKSILDPAEVNDVDLAGTLDRLKIIDGDTMELGHFGPPSSLMYLSEAHSMHLTGLPLSFGLAQLTRPHAPRPALPPDYTYNWRINLPPGLSMTKGEHDAMLDMYDGFCSGWGSVVDMTSFRHDLSLCCRPASPPLRTDSYSPLLHNALLAFMSCYNASSSDSTALAERAIQCISHEIERPMLSAVRGLMLLSSFHSARTLMNSGYMYFGMAVRMGETLGLNLDATHLVTRGSMKASQKVSRDEMAWAVFVQDKLQSIAMGRPQSMRSAEMPLQLPLVDSQRDTVPVSSNDSRPAFRSTTFVEHCKLSMIAADLLDAFYTTKVFSAESKLAQATRHDLNKRLQTWLNYLPVTLQLGDSNTLPHILTLHMYHSFLVILLHRPFYQVDSANSTTAPCDDAAQTIHSLIHRYGSCYGLEYTSITLAHTVFNAGIVFLLQVTSSTAEAPARNSSLGKLQEMIVVLNAMRTTWEIAGWNASVLSSLRADYVDQVQLPVEELHQPIEAPPSLLDIPSFESYLESIDFWRTVPMGNLSPWE